MDKKVCLDTDACISFVKGEPQAEKISDLIGDGKLFVSSVTVFELYLRKENLNEVADFLKGIFVLNFDEESAVKASDLQKELRGKGSALDFRDIFIASAAIVNNCSLVTFNQKHFSRIKGLELVKL
jgi:predicted nucleic acid-binding protein